MKVFQTIIMSFFMATSVLAQDLEVNASPIRPLEVTTNFEETYFADKPWDTPARNGNHREMARRNRRLGGDEVRSLPGGCRFGRRHQQQ